MTFLSFAIFLVIISFIGRFAFKFIMARALIGIVVYVVVPQQYKTFADEFTNNNYTLFFDGVKKISSFSSGIAEKSSKELKEEIKEVEKSTLKVTSK